MLRIPHSSTRLSIVLCGALASHSGLALAQYGSSEPVEMEATTVMGTAEEEARQALGSSVITAEDIARQPPANDLSEIIRRQPGVNLTGNSASGARGNNRQIDLRGMGPENTLILIDGLPSTSRNAVRYGWDGDRDTRGETNWVPAEEVERIEILRGPAAARYGSGAMGGVINIITKRPTEQWHGSMTFYALEPESGDEGNGRRANFNLSGPLTEALAFRVYGNIARTDADALSINEGHQTSEGSVTAGREGVRNKDINALLSWQLDPQQVLDFETSYSRQGNIYAGDTMLNNSGGNDAFVRSLYGHETNVLQRSSFTLKHKGTWDWGNSTLGLSYDYTRNWRLNEGLSGRTEGGPSEGDGAFMSRLRNTRAFGNLDLPIDSAMPQVLTIGAEYLHESLSDPGSLRAQSSDPEPGQIAGFDRTQTKTTANSYAFYVEDNVQVTDRTVLTPGLRFDDHQTYGDNWSPSLNLSHEITDRLTFKGGIARAYKTPNLYQSNPNYLLYSRGNGCTAITSGNGGCYLVGNESLRPEISINKELGLAYDAGTWRASATYFRNDYKNKIVGGNEFIYRLGDTGPRVLEWENTGKAVVQGVEGNLFIPLTDTVDWNTNFTYMIESKDKQTGDPLSIIPKYTINSTLDWYVTEKLSAQLNVTHYGKQEAPSYSRRTNTDYEAAAQKDIDPYTLVGVSSGYEFNEHYKVRFGVNNLFDKRIYREGNASSAGAVTYNEPGRAYFASFTASF